MLPTFSSPLTRMSKSTIPEKGNLSVTTSNSLTLTVICAFILADDFWQIGKGLHQRRVPETPTSEGDQENEPTCYLSGVPGTTGAWLLRDGLQACVGVNHPLLNGKYGSCQAWPNELESLVWGSDSYIFKIPSLPHRGSPETHSLVNCLPLQFTLKSPEFGLTKRWQFPNGLLGMMT